MGDGTCMIEGCGGRLRSRGWCNKHYMRWLKHGSPHHVPQRAKTPMERFTEKIEVADCWHWLAGVDYDGYGIFSFEGRDVRAHRWIYMQLVGDIPADLQIDHLCRNTGCVNPDHLEPVPCRVNVHRSASPPAHNYAKTHCLRGHPFDEVNTYWFGPGYRMCRECNRRSDASRGPRARARGYRPLKGTDIQQAAIRSGVKPKAIDGQVVR